MKTETKVTVSGKEIIVSKLLHAPRELVWEVWTKPEHITQWWGPVGFTTTDKGMDVRPGGVWQFMMHGPDGRDYPNKIVFMDVVKPEKLVYRHAGDEDTEPVSFHVTVTFTAKGDLTEVHILSTFASAAELERVNKEYGAVQGARENMERCEEYLRKM